MKIIWSFLLSSLLQHVTSTILHYDDDDYEDYGSGGILPETPLSAVPEDEVPGAIYILLLIILVILLCGVLVGAGILCKNYMFNCFKIPRFYRFGRLWGYPIPNHDAEDMEMDYYHT